MRVDGSWRSEGVGEERRVGSGGRGETGRMRTAEERRECGAVMTSSRERRDSPCIAWLCHFFFFLFFGEKQLELDRGGTGKQRITHVHAQTSLETCTQTKIDTQTL